MSGTPSILQIVNERIINPLGDGFVADADVIAYASAFGSAVEDALDGLLSSYVQSFNSRTGAVMPTAGDYAATQVTNDSTVAGASVADALNAVAAPAAVDVSYDNATSGLTATDVQAAIDEVAAFVVPPTPHATMRPVDEANIVDDGFMNFSVVTTRGNISVGADAITINEAGIYQVDHIAGWGTASNTTDPRIITFDCKAGGTTVARPGITRFSSDAGLRMPMQFGFSWYLEVGDTIQFQNVTGFTITPTPSASSNRITVTKVGE